jgi:hypothetical protein
MEADDSAKRRDGLLKFFVNSLSDSCARPYMEPDSGKSAAMIPVLNHFASKENVAVAAAALPSATFIGSRATRSRS